MTEETAVMGHNSQLTDDQKRALAYHHKGHVERALAVKKKADAGLKNTAKKALADGVSMDQIKLLIQLEQEGGEAKLRAELREKCLTARWAGVPIGGQMDWLDRDFEEPTGAREAGKIAGMKGEDCKAPYDGDTGQEWIEGWHEGQEILISSLSFSQAREAAEQAEPPKRRPKNKPQEAAAAA